MLLGEVFKYLEQKSLHRPLMVWFNKTHLSIQGRITSLHLTRELELQYSWKAPTFGLVFSEEFSSFLKSKGYDYDPVEISRDFSNSIWRNRYMFCGKGCLKNGTPVHVVRMEHAVNGLGTYGLRRLRDPRKILQEMRRLLAEGAVIRIGHNGIAWFALYEMGLRHVDDAKTACDLLGKQPRIRKTYVVLSILHTDQLSRPTIHEGGLSLPFRPHCDDFRWGRTLSCGSLRCGVPEAVIEEREHKAKIEKALAPSDDVLPRPTNEELWKYFRRETRSLKKENAKAYEDLGRAWQRKTIWWR